MSVRVVKVGSIAEQIRGVTYSKEDASDRPAEGMIPILRANNITEDGLVFDDLVYVPDRCVNPRQRILKGDIVIAASSGSIDVVGKAAPALSDVNAAFGAFCKVVRPGSEVCPDYLAHYFRTANYRRIISSLAAGANINNLRSEHINELQLPLPKREEQTRLAAILDKADAIRCKRQQALRLTDDFLRSVFLDMFGTTENPSCRRIAVGDLIRFMTSGGRGWATYYADEGSRFLRSMDVRMNYIGDSDAVFVAAPDNAEAKRTMVQSGDVLLTITGSLIGRVAPVPAHLAGAFISQHVAILRLNQVLPSKFVAWALSVEEGQRQIQSLQSGQVKPGLNFDQIRKLKVPHPSKEKIRDFLAIVEIAQRKQASDQRQASTSETLFASLQQRAFSGQL